MLPIEQINGLNSLENIGTRDVDDIKANVIKLAGDVLLWRQKKNKLEIV